MVFQNDRIQLTITSTWNKNLKKYTLFISMQDDTVGFSTQILPKGINMLQKELNLIIERNKELETKKDELAVTTKC